jgi:Pyruvate dehydrogenase complex, dehydrogenase (E1) component
VLLTARRKESEQLAIPELSVFDAVLKGSGGKEQSTTMLMVRLISSLLKEKAIKDRVVQLSR